MTIQTDEKIRIDLAYAYRIMAFLAMDDHTYTHLSARPKGSDYYYIFPFGFRFEEVTPECLLKISLDGEILEGQEYQYNKTGYTIHGSIYNARPEVNSIFHLHTPASVAVSAMRRGLLPISQWSLHFWGQVAYHDYNSLILEGQTQGNQLITDLGSSNILFLRNHGFLTCGQDAAEAMFYSYHLEQACKTQIAALSSGEELIYPDEQICKKSNEDLLSFEEKLGQRDWISWKRNIKRYYKLEF